MGHSVWHVVRIRLAVREGSLLCEQVLRSPLKKWTVMSWVRALPWQQKFLSSELTKWKNSVQSSPAIWKKYPDFLCS